MLICVVCFVLQTYPHAIRAASRNNCVITHMAAQALMLQVALLERQAAAAEAAAAAAELGAAGASSWGLGPGARSLPSPRSLLGEQHLLAQVCCLHTCLKACVQVPRVCNCLQSAGRGGMSACSLVFLHLPWKRAYAASAVDLLTAAQHACV